MIKSSLAVILIIVALIIGAVAGYLVAQSPQAGRASTTAEQASEPVANPFEEARINPLEGRGYENPFAEVEVNPFQ